MITTFDFDNTLTVTQFDPEDWWFTKDAGPNKEIVQTMIDHLNRGFDVHIVTSRLERVESLNEIQKLLIEQNVFHRISGIHFTNGKLKAAKLEELGSILHHDDDEQELEHLSDNCHGVLITNGFLDTRGNVCDPMEARFNWSNQPTPP